MAHADVEVRDRRGDWRPPRIKSPPLFHLPFRPLAVLKWIFGWQGYLLPWNVTYAVVAILTWVFLTPTLPAMRTFEFWWVGVIFARNMALIFLVVGAWHLRLYVQQAQGTRFKYTNRWLARDNPTFLFKNQVLDNMFWTVVSAVPVWTAYEVLTLWMMANRYIPTITFDSNPVWFVLLMFLIPLFREVHFYLIHRLIHWPPLYRSVHSLHHKNANPGPWSGLAMHPVEHILYFSGVLIHWILPSHPIHVIFHLQHLAFAPAQGHSGFERVEITDKFGVKTGDYFHYLHHKHFECNYGNELMPIDEWFGTFHDGSKEAEERMNERFMARARNAGRA
ncbi:MAG TPA: sterol desaturase family protein [Bauldia sp.]|nr:sterol desaturase family protein [Bauldia sp.]